jgi:hypothetical protein
MSAADFTDGEAQQAKDRLELAIRDYFAAMHPDEMVTSWCLVVHRVSDDLDAENESVVSVLVPTNQIFPMTRGLLDVALESERGRA